MRPAYLALSACVACAVGPDFHRPPAPRTTRYTRDGITGTIAADGTAQVIRMGEPLAGAWWQLFGSAELVDLVRISLANNPNLDAARASLRRSEYLLRAGRGVYYPQVDASAGVSRQRFSPSRFGGTAAPNEFTLYTLAGTVGYTLDVFGGQRRTVEALHAQVDAQCFTLAAAWLTVTGNVVNTAIARASYAAEIAATDELVTALARQVEIARAQELAGTGTHAAVLTFEAQLASTSATLPPLRQQLVEADTLLATLVGRAPADWQAPALALSAIALPRELPVSVPADLVRQRPDILTAEANLHVSTANIGVATAAMLPSFSLSGSIGSDTSQLDSLFSYSSLVWNVGANLLAPLFHGGTLSNQRKAAIEAYRQSLAAYRQTVLGAFADVSNSLHALVNDAHELDDRLRAVRASTDALHIVSANYEAGLVGYLDVLTITTQYQQAQLSMIAARARRLQDTVALFIALGGGWWSATQVCPRLETSHVPAIP